MVRCHIKLFTLQMSGTRSQRAEPRSKYSQRSGPDVVLLREGDFKPEEIFSAR
jgi:hypothetical protein